MRTRWSLPVLGGCCILGLAACATAAAPAGVGGEPVGSSSPGGASPTTATAGASSSGTSVDPFLCGNGKIDPGESCDGLDLGGNDCSSFGLANGTLVCSDYCAFFLAGCDKVEICDDGFDNDLDTLIDCEDDDCSNAATCVDSCTPARVLGLPDTVKGTTHGRPSVHAASCSAPSGNEAMYQITALTTGPILLQLTATDVPSFSLSVRAACDDDASEIACASGSFQQALTVALAAGKTYFVMVDTVGPVPGGFQLDVHSAEPETTCDDHLDNDGNGLIDCGDPSCQALPACVPGTAPAGDPCTASADCFSSTNDPICISEATFLFPGGYCSELCVLGADDCPAGSECVDSIQVPGPQATCMRTCAVTADCRPGYACLDGGAPKPFCVL